MREPGEKCLCKTRRREMNFKVKYIRIFIRRKKRREPAGNAGKKIETVLYSFAPKTQKLIPQNNIKILIRKYKFYYFSIVSFFFERKYVCKA